MSRPVLVDLHLVDLLSPRTKSQKREWQGLVGEISDFKNIFKNWFQLTVGPWEALSEGNAALKHELAAEGIDAQSWAQLLRIRDEQQKLEGILRQSNWTLSSFGTDGRVIHSQKICSKINIKKRNEGVSNNIKSLKENINFKLTTKGIYRKSLFEPHVVLFFNPSPKCGSIRGTLSFSSAF